MKTGRRSGGGVQRGGRVGALTVDAAGACGYGAPWTASRPTAAWIDYRKIPRFSITNTVTDAQRHCPPRLLPPRVLHVTEGAPPTLLGVLTATDHDVWALGHGRPFNLSLAPDNPPPVLALVRLLFDPHLDSGRGGAEVWTADSVDREEHRQLEVRVRVSDAGGVTGTHVLTVIVDDINDNPMKPRSKTVYLWKTQGGGSDAPLGRIYVDDPDDWDIGDKAFEWVGAPHPLFSISHDSGAIFASSQVREGR
ncbi:Neural-cadherin [Penaeus vannamei]|uniref:Neural-cadherin n=1 Tax=Penaeus vannamei TaxID=6689 RepID=A0A3R7PVW9_PENVA|nr:Neural-cadherin [Penaeus vannamei]